LEFGRTQIQYRMHETDFPHTDFLILSEYSLHLHLSQGQIISESLQLVLLISS